MDSGFSRHMRIFLCATACALMLGCASSQRVVSSADNILRLHVIANSDSAADQTVKLQVRDAVLACIEPGESAAETRAYLMEHGAQLQSAVERTLRENGFDYGAQLLLGSYDFPDRTCGNTLYKAGEYEALRIVLGDGAGQNWWCVLFPPLCIVTTEDEAPVETDEIVFESTILNWIRDWRNAS